MKRIRTRLRAGFGGFQPITLFASGSQGAWYDPSDFSTLFQDSAGTTPVTATGQPVGKILDKSGKNNHATQATSTARPTLQQDASGFYYLLFDGVDDCLFTASIDFTATAQVTHFTGMRKLVDSGSPTVHELSVAGDTNAGAWYLRAPSGGLANYQSLQRGASANASVTPSSLTAPLSFVLTSSLDLSAPLISLRRNSATDGSSSGATGGGNFGNYPLYIGRRANASLPWNGWLYSLIVVGTSKSAGDITLAERWVGSKMGISL